jgi:fumarate reductase iron-sulfur subunit
MADSIQLRVSRFRPDTDAGPHWQVYDVPLRKEWTVLDGLNHV